MADVVASWVKGVNPEACVGAGGEIDLRAAGVWSRLQPTATTLTYTLPEWHNSCNGWSPGEHVSGVLTLLDVDDEKVYGEKFDFDPELEALLGGIDLQRVATTPVLGTLRRVARVLDDVAM